MSSDRISHPDKSYWPALDGLRGIAILLVFAFHLPLQVFRAGSLGVILFFVLSGFLITTILLKESDRNGRVNLRRFYTRRARRLLPALLLVVVAHLILQITVLGEEEFWWARTWPVLGYVANYSVIAGVDMAHMAHTWSLAIEEHFYLLWPATLMLIPARWRFPVTGGLAVGFILWRLALLVAGAPNIRIFFASDTNAFAPLLGCALAVGFHERRFPSPGRNVSVLSTAILIIAACLPIDFTDRRLLWAAMPAAIIAALAIHAALFQPASWLENRTLRWFGMISYGLYLWHFMLISLHWERQPLPPLLLMIVTPVVAAWLSWKYVEAPILRRKWHVRDLGGAGASDGPILAANMKGSRSTGQNSGSVPLETAFPTVTPLSEYQPTVSHF